MDIKTALVLGLLGAMQLTSAVANPFCGQLVCRAGSGAGGAIATGTALLTSVVGATATCLFTSSTTCLDLR